MSVRERNGLLLIAATLGWCALLMREQGTEPRALEQRSLAYYLNADPTHEMKEAVRRGDRRFLGIKGLALFVVGVPKGAYSLVDLHGTNPVEGTGDDRPFDEFQRAATDYAVRYNALLAQELVHHPDAKTRGLLAEAREEIGGLAGHDAAHDARWSFASFRPQFILMAGESNLKVGLPKDDKMMLVARYGWRQLVVSAALFADSDDQRRVREFTRNYVVPYNRTLYNLLVQSRSKRSQPSPSASRPA